MRTLYLRNVPDEVVKRLERQAQAESTSVNAVARSRCYLADLLPDQAVLPRLLHAQGQHAADHDH